MNITKKAAKYTDPDSNEFVTVPELPIPSASTTFSIPGMRTWKLPHETIFDGAADGIGSALNTVRSLGVESAISSSYVVSDIYCATGASGGAYSNLEGAMNTVSSGASTNPDGVSVENKKALYALTRITLSSMVSGDSSDFTVADFPGLDAEDSGLIMFVVSSFALDGLLLTVFVAVFFTAVLVEVGLLLSLIILDSESDKTTTKQH